jgi:hypothetical protein
MVPKEKYFRFLDGLPSARMTAGMGACQKLKATFPELSHQEATQVAVDWLETLPIRHWDGEQLWWSRFMSNCCHWAIPLLLVAISCSWEL